MGRAGGMCEFPGCGALLYEDPLTKQNSIGRTLPTSSVIPQKVLGGEKDASEKSTERTLTILFFCALTCHKRIDTKEGEKISVKVLRQMKDEHEGRIRKNNVCSSDQ